MRTPEETFAAGLKVRNAMFGEAGAEHQIQDATDFTRPLQDMVTRYCFGEVWTREALTRAQRSMITLAMLIALGRPHEIRVKAIASGISSGTRDEIREVLLHSMIYAGVPAAVDSFLSSVEVFKQLGLEN